MLIFAHAGITLGSAYLLDNLLRRQAEYRISSRQPQVPVTIPNDIAKPTSYPQCTAVDIKPVKGTSLPAVDYRLVLLGSLLPDLIDKPIGNIIFRAVFENGRIFSHSLLFLLLIALITAFFILGKKDYRPLYVAYGVLVHLLLDAMWLEPLTLFWPFLGFSFYKYSGMELTPWFDRMMYDLITKPEVYISEAIGVAFLIFFTIKIVAGKKIAAFLQKGII